MPERNDPPQSTITIRVDLPLRTVSESNQRGHWSRHSGRHQTHRGSAKLLTCLAATGVYYRDRHTVARLVLTRIAPRLLDPGNVAVSLKAIQDGVCDALQISDGPGTGIVWAYEQRRSAVGEGYAVRVDIHLAER